MSEPNTANQGGKGNFTSILDRAPKEVERPKTLPIGTYIWVVKGVPRYDKSPKTGTKFVEFTVVPQGPVQGPDGGNLDVDQELLDEALTRKDGTKIAIQSKAQRITYWETEDAIWRLKDFLKHLGHDVENEDTSLRELCNESANRQFAGYIAHKPSEDGETMYANITKTMALE